MATSPFDAQVEARGFAAPILILSSGVLRACAFSTTSESVTLLHTSPSWLSRAMLIKWHSARRIISELVSRPPCTYMFQGLKIRTDIVHRLNCDIDTGRARGQARRPCWRNACTLQSWPSARGCVDTLTSCKQIFLRIPYSRATFC